MSNKHDRPNENDKTLTMHFFKTAFLYTVLLAGVSCAEDSQEALQIELEEGQVVTFEGDVRQLISEDCLNCHTNPPQNGAPFPLITFDEVMGRANDISNSINGRTVLMPPGINLPQSRINIIDTWIAQGLIEN